MIDNPAECLVAPVVAADGPSTTSGYAKRRKKSQLPRVFYILETSTCILSGVFRLTRCVWCDSTAVRWDCDRVIIFDSPVELEESDFKRHGSFLELTSDAELQLRTSGATIGGSVKDHFLDEAGSRWWC